MDRMTIEFTVLLLTVFFYNFVFCQKTEEFLVEELDNLGRKLEVDIRDQYPPELDMLDDVTHKYPPELDHMSDDITHKYPAELDHMSDDITHKYPPELDHMLDDVTHKYPAELDHMSDDTGSGQEVDTALTHLTPTKVTTVNEVGQSTETASSGSGDEMATSTSLPDALPNEIQSGVHHVGLQPKEQADNAVLTNKDLAVQKLSQLKKLIKKQGKRAHEKEYREAEIEPKRTFSLHELVHEIQQEHQKREMGEMSGEMYQSTTNPSMDSGDGELTTSTPVTLSNDIQSGVQHIGIHPRKQSKKGMKATKLLILKKLRELKELMTKVTRDQ